MESPLGSKTGANRPFTVSKTIPHVKQNIRPGRQAFEKVCNSETRRDLRGAVSPYPGPAASPELAGDACSNEGGAAFYH